MPRLPSPSRSAAGSLTMNSPIVALLAWREGGRASLVRLQNGGLSRFGARGAGNPDRHRLRGRRATLLISAVEWNQSVGLGIIGGAGAARHLVRHHPEAAGDAYAVVRRDRRKVDQVVGGQLAPVHFLAGEEQDAALAVYTAITVVEGVDRCVELVVTSDRGQPQHVRIILVRILLESGKDEEVRLARWRVPDALACGGRQVESAPLSNARIEILEDRKYRFDGVTDPIVVRDHFLPIDA